MDYLAKQKINDRNKVTSSLKKATTNYKNAISTNITHYDEISPSMYIIELFTKDVQYMVQ